MKKQAGFSLLEILVAMAIMAILGGVMVIKFAGKTQEANLIKIKSDIQALESALIQYSSDNFMYPTTEQGLEALETKPTSRPEPKQYARNGYIKLRQDPWGNPYQYAYPGEFGEYDIYSLGADGEEGGEGMAADIGNWNADEVLRAFKTGEQ
ncbi:MAG: type II secretion system major pseudopilin GspG [Kangiellaceae bacterium]|jgi:general secretion pathway protein G